MMNTQAVVHIRKGEARSLKAGGMWIYDNEIERIEGEFENGDILRVEDFDGYPLGCGFINTRSKLTVRMLSRKKDTVIDDAFIEMRVRNAWEYRRQTVDTSSCRLIFGEADFLPGIVIDKFSDVLVVESLALGIDRLKPLILEKLDLDENEKETLEHIVRQMETERGLDRAAAIAHMRFDFIDKVCDETVVRPRESREHLRSVRIDKVLTGRHTAIPCFVGIMGLVFFLTFGVIGKLLSALLSMGINALGGVVDSALTAWNAPYVLRSLVMDGIWGGVGSVLQFLPIIVTLFFFLSLLEDSGYMARVAFVMDKLLRKIGLSGRSIVPMLIGFGCTVPGVMASRTLTSERDRKMTILLTPFMSCSAKLPIYAFFSAAFFPKYSALVMTALYFGGILMGLLMALLLRGTMFRGEAVPFVMELPNYRLPGAKNVCQLLWDKAKDFLQRAFTVIFLATLIIWFLQTFDLRFAIVSDSSQSILEMIAGVIAPVFRPMGFGDWRISTALISGFMAKESVVSTLTVLFGSTSDILACLTPLAAASLLVFCLLYTPCVAAIASIKRELGGKWAVFVVIAQCSPPLSFTASVHCSYKNT